MRHQLGLLLDALSILVVAGVEGIAPTDAAFQFAFEDTAVHFDELLSLGGLVST